MCSIFKRVAVGSITVLTGMFISDVTQVQADVTVVQGWVQSAGNWYYYDEGGSVTTGWMNVSGRWYYMDQSGVMCTGWQQIEGDWYYMDGEGAMQTGWVIPNGTWYYLDYSGKMLKNCYVGDYWLNEDGSYGYRGKWHFNSTGWWWGDSSGWYVRNEWRKISDVWYYFNSRGYMVTGWHAINGIWYYFDASGAMRQNEYIDGWWLNENGAWTYQHRAGWQRNSIGWWYQDSAGWYPKSEWRVIDGVRYWFDDRGYMGSSWEFVDGQWLYFDSSGVMANDLIITLDPGHGGREHGAIANGASEKDLNLVIALAAKKELESYKGVKVYITRDRDVYCGLRERVQYANNVKSSVIISLHNNAVGNSGGAEVWVQNNHYDRGAAQVSHDLGSCIENQLIGLGIQNLGVKTKNSGSYRYADGSQADYYAICRFAKEMGLAGIIVEHAYMDNVSDYEAFLSTQDKLEALGRADAKGIAAYFGLKK